MTITIDIGVACSSFQTYDWWAPLITNLLREHQRGIFVNQLIATFSALPDSNKSNIVMANLPEYNQEIAEQKKRADLTDANRNKTVYSFWNGSKSGGKSDWIFWMDDDTTIPDATISRLLDTGKKFVAGLYFLGRHPYNPVAYVRDRRDKWGYRALYNYPQGALIEVDSVGMGCTLIHRDVYQAILDQHELYVRPNGTLLPIHKSKVKSGFTVPLEGDEQVVNDVLMQRLMRAEPDDNRAWPFYAMEYIRTEDHYFCEMAIASGYRPWVDTSLMCDHIKSKHITYQDYEKARNEQNGLA